MAAYLLIEMGFEVASDPDFAELFATINLYKFNQNINQEIPYIIIENEYSFELLIEQRLLNGTTQVKESYDLKTATEVKKRRSDSEASISSEHTSNINRVRVSASENDINLKGEYNEGDAAKLKGASQSSIGNQKDNSVELNLRSIDSKVSLNYHIYREEAKVNAVITLTNTKNFDGSINEIYKILSSKLAYLLDV